MHVLSITQFNSNPSYWPALHEFRQYSTLDLPGQARQLMGEKPYYTLKLDGSFTPFTIATHYIHCSTQLTKKPTTKSQLNSSTAQLRPSVSQVNETFCKWSNRIQTFSHAVQWLKTGKTYMHRSSSSSYNITVKVSSNISNLE